MSSPEPSTARDMARSLLAGLVDANDSDKDAATAVQRVWARATERLRGAVGDDGYHALLGRALQRAQAQHPVLLEIRQIVDGTIDRNAIEAAAEKHGFSVVRAAIEGLLTEVIDILSSLIGADMVLNLLENDGTSFHGPDTRPTR
jgi:hypothetical protein